MSYTANQSRKSHAFSIILVMIVLMLAGAACIHLLNIQYSPVSENLSLNVYAAGEGSARVMEAEVTSVIEGALNTVEGVCSISTTSTQNFCYLSLEFKKGTDMETTRFDVSTRLRQIRDKLPEGTVTEISGSAYGGGRDKPQLLSYTINADMPSSEIVRYAQDHIVTAISRIDGVDEVNTSGAMPYEWVLTFDPDALRAAGLTPTDLASALNSYYQNSIAGTQVQEDKLILIRIRNNSLQNELERIPIRKVNGRMFHIGDFARVSYQEQEPVIYSRINGLNTIELSVNGQEGINTMAVCNEIKATIEEMRASFPDNFALRLSYDASLELGNEIEKIFNRAVMSLAILLVFVLIVSRSFRYLAVIGLTITVNLLGAVIFYKLFGVDIEMYSMAGITVSLGIIIDTAIVIADHYSYYGNRKVMTSVAGALLTTIAALLLIFFLPQESRANLTGFVWVIVINLTLSMAVAFLFVPALLEKIPIRSKGVVRNSMSRLRRLAMASAKYERFVIWGRCHRWLYITLTLFLFGIAFLSFHIYNHGHISIDRESAQPETVMNIYARMPEGGSLKQLNGIIGEMENWLQQFDGISLFSTMLSGTDGRIEIHFKDEYLDNGFPLQLKQMAWNKAMRLGGATWHIPAIGSSDTDFSNSVRRTSWSNTISLYGYNYDLLYRYAEELIDSIRLNRRVTDAGFSQGYGSMAGNEFRLKYDDRAVCNLGLDVNRYYSYLREQLYDSPIGTVPSADGYTTVRLRSAMRDYYDIWHIRTDMVDIDSVRTRLDDVGSITKMRTGLDIERTNQEYVINIGYEFAGPTDLRFSMENDITGRFAKRLPMGFRISRNVNYNQWQKARQQTVLIVIVVLVIFMICASLFESLRQAGTIVLLIPASFIGLLLVYPITGIAFGQGGFAAMVMLCGITVNAGIYLTSEYRTIIASAGRHSSVRCYVKAFNRKIVPTLLTILSTVLGLVPFLFDGRKNPFWLSFAIGVMAGMLFSILAIMLVMPTFFAMNRTDGSSTFK
ncbi:MAG: efflux RND transporter permease subunit [Bacteroidaceae bacterium]|nr:efflux RND transporter permease subunit [Bacteroidaceae bacterium]